MSSAARYLYERVGKILSGGGADTEWGWGRYRVGVGQIQSGGGVDTEWGWGGYRVGVGWDLLFYLSGVD